MYADIQHVLIDRRRIARRVRELAREITADLCPPGCRQPDEDLELTLVPILTGSIIFLADLVRQLPVRMKLRLISVNSYPGPATRSQGVRLQRALSNLPASLAGQQVLVVDDILDSGHTLQAVTRLLQRRGPKWVRTCVLLDKKLPGRKVAADYAGFAIPNKFVVGYGLDFDDHYRNLPDIVTLKPRVIAQRQAAKS